MAKFKVLTPIDHDNKRIDPGKVVDLDEEVAAPLLAVNAVESISKKQAAAEAAAAAGEGSGQGQ